MTRYGTVLVVLIGLIALTAASASAQGRVNEANWFLGIKGGLNFSTFYGSSVGGDVDNRVAMILDGFATRKFGNRLALQLEAALSTKGAKTTFRNVPEANGGDVTVNVKINYFEIPLLAVISFPKGQSAFQIIGGVSAAFKISSNVDVSAGGVTVPGYFDKAKSTDYNAIIGVGGEWNQYSYNFLLEARWTIGLTSIDDSAADLDVKNSVISLMIGLGFPLSG